MLNSRLFRLQQNQSRHFSTVLIRTNWYTISCKYKECLGLKSITLGNSVMSIGNWAFDICLELTTVISMIEEPFEINDTFLIHYEGEYDEPEVYIPKTLYVPKGTKKIYKRTKGWNVFHNIVESK